MKSYVKINSPKHSFNYEIDVRDVCKPHHYPPFQFMSAEMKEKRTEQKNS